jgi:hypothetical protein
MNTAMQSRLMPVLYMGAACDRSTRLLRSGAAARTWLERGLALAERLDVAPGEFLVDPQVALLGSLSLVARHGGFLADPLPS